MLPPKPVQQGTTPAVQIEITYESPVVFAGEKLNALITVRNTRSSSHEVGTTAAPPEEDIRTPDSLANSNGTPIASEVGEEATNTSTTESADTTNPGIVSDANASTASSSDRHSAPSSQQLLMGSAQVQSYFVVDEELIDIDQFAHAKTQGVVVGSNGSLGYASTNNGGFLHGLTSGLGSILQIKDGNGNPLEGRNSPDLVGRGVVYGNGISRGNRQNGGTAGPASHYDDNDAVPIFSTPQSLLFVDLNLEAGQSRTFRYSLQLPKTLPPSCKAKSIRIHYNLVIGMQKLDKKGHPRLSTTHVPFRVFPFVSRDEKSQVCHDLRMPVVLQQDTAEIVQLPLENMTADEAFSYAKNMDLEQESSSVIGKAELMGFINDLMTSKHTAAEMVTEMSDLGIQNVLSSEENIKYLTRYQHGQSMKSKFDIGRGNRRLATIYLSKPVYRVGENIVFIVDYTDAALKTFHITATLETEESIRNDLLKQLKNQNHDLISHKLPAIDTTSLTRRVYSQATMSTYTHKKSTFEFTIPATATPQFATTAIALKWVLKLDFITSPAPKSDGGGRQQDTTHAASPHTPPNQHPPQPHAHTPPTPTSVHPNGTRTASQAHSPSLSHFEASTSPVEVAHINSQGLIAAVKETIPCDTFSCKIPLTVMPTNQDIGALLEHSMSATKVWQI